MTSVLCITELELFGKRSFASSLSSPRHHHQSQAYVYVWEKWEPSVNIYANCKVYTTKCQVQHFFSSTLLRRPPQVFAILGRANGAEKTFCICCLASILLSSHKIDVIAPIRVVNSIVKPFQNTPHSVICILQLQVERKPQFPIWISRIPFA